MDRDLYSVIGAERGATEQEIRSAYRKLARQHHPDLNPNDPAAEDRFKELSAAYEILNDPDKRALYDEFGAEAKKLGYDAERAEEYRQWRRRADAAAGFRGAEGAGPFGSAPGASYADLQDLLGNLFREQQRGPAPGRDVEVSLGVSFRDAVLGTTADVELSGNDGEPERISLKIPAGVDDGQRLRLRGKGRPGTEGGPSGDLYARIVVAPHAVFTREGQNLHLSVPVTVPEALVGATVEVPTLDGSVRVKVPAGTQSGARLRLRGKGVALESEEPGDLIITLTVNLPVGGDEELRTRLAEEFAELYDGDVRETLREEAGR